MYNPEGFLIPDMQNITIFECLYITLHVNVVLYNHEVKTE